MSVRRDHPRLFDLDPELERGLTRFDRDPRRARLVEIDEVVGDYAICRNVETGRRTRIRTDRLASDRFAFASRTPTTDEMAVTARSLRSRLGRLLRWRWRRRAMSDEQLPIFTG